MKLTVTFEQRSLTITLTPAAARALAERASPLHVDAQLRLGCMTKKALVFDDGLSSDRWYAIHSKLLVSYQSMISEACQIDGSDAHYRQTPKQVGRLNWLQLDFVNRQWRGDFGLEE